ncbi:unnamed protein product [Closterium sp. NIES-54]
MPCMLRLIVMRVTVTCVFNPDQGIDAAALGASELAAPGTSESAAPGTSESAAPGAGESALSGTAPTEALHAFTLDFGASLSFFCDSTTLTPLSRPVAASLADPSRGPVLVHSSTVLPCPAAPSGLLSGLHLPSFSTNLVSGADLQDPWVDQFAPGGQRVTHCTCSRTGRHLATFTHRPGSSLCTLTTASPPVTASSQVAASGQVFSAVSRSSPAPAPCSCRPLTHETLLWHHRLGHPSQPRLRGMASRTLLSESFGSDLRFLLQHSDRGGEFSSDLVRAFSRAEGIRQTFTLPASPQQNGIAERRIGMVMDVVRTSMIHAAAPHFLWPFAVQYAAHQLNLQPRGPAPSGVTQVDPVEPVKVVDDSGAARGAEPAGAGPGGAEPGVVASEGAELGGAEPGCVEPGGAERGGTEPGGAESGGAEPGATGPAAGGASGAGAAGDAAGAAAAGGASGAAGGAAGAGAAGAAGPGGAGAGGTGSVGGPAGVGATGGAAAAGPGGARTGGTGAARVGGATGVGAVGAGAVPSRGAGGAGAVGGPVAGGAVEVVAGDPGAEGTSAVSTVSGGAARPRPYYLQRASPLPGPSPYSGPTRGLTERREPESRPVSPESCPESPVRAVRTDRRVPLQRPPSFPGTHSMTLRPSTAPQRVPLPSPPASSLPALTNPESDSLRTASPTVTRLLATVVNDPSFESTASSALVAELVDFATHCRLDYAASLVAESASVCPLSVMAMDAEMASWKSTGTYVDAVPPPGANIGSLHEEIWLRRPPGFTGSFPPGTQSSLRQPDYGLRQAPREWHNTLRTTLATLGFAPSTTDPSLFLRTDATLPPFYVLVYPNDLVFATADIEALAHVKSELQKRHTCTDLGELTIYLGLQITRDRAQRTITLTHSSCEAEIYAGAMAAQELRCLTYLLTDLGEAHRSPPVLYVDNEAMLALCQEHRKKHIDLRYFLARELQQRGQLCLAYVAFRANTADVFTKALQPCYHLCFCSVLGLVPNVPHLLTS